MLGISFNIEGIGYVKAEYRRKNLHEVKSLAGKVFHRPDVISVCVFDEQGFVPLYLRKTPFGVHREERK
jgi:hypothetical protein